MTNQEFIEYIRTAYGIDSKYMIYINRLLKINVNIQDTAKLLLRIGVNINKIWEFLFTLSIYCDYNYVRLLELNELLIDYNRYFGKSGVLGLIYGLIKDENSNERTLYYNIKINRVPSYVTKVKLGDAEYDFMEACIRYENKTKEIDTMENIGFIWIGDNAWEIYRSKDRYYDKQYKECREVITKYLEDNREYKFIIPLLPYAYNRKILRLISNYMFKEM